MSEGVNPLLSPAPSPSPSTGLPPPALSSPPPSDEGAERPSKKPRLEVPPVTWDEEDLLTSGWLYLDEQGQRQGPYTTRDMAHWLQAGFFPPTTPTRRVSTPSFSPISAFPELRRPPPPLPARLLAPQVAMPLPHYMMPHMAPPPPAPSVGEDYTQRANFTRYHGKFTKYDEVSHFTARGLAADKEGRELGKFLDADAYQEAMLQLQEAGQDKRDRPKLSKAQVEYFKQRKKLQKVRRILSDEEDRKRH